MLSDLSRRLGDEEVRNLVAYAVGFPTPEKVEQSLRPYRESSTSRLLGHETGGVLTGCLGLDHSDPDEAVIRHIAVLPDFRRQGIGRQMIALAAAAFDIRRLTAETDADAVTFYERCGFTVVSLGEQYPGVERFMCTRSWTRESTTARGG